MKDYKEGFKNGIPIGIAYFAVSFAFGVSAVSSGLAPITAIIISATNLTSSGQFAGVKLITAGASFFELALTVFLINIRYILMSLSLSQKIDEKTKFYQRFIMAFGITDEIFAYASTEHKKISIGYMTGIMTLPIICWTLGTALGAIGSTFIPEKLLTALNIAIYAMFIGIMMPDAKKSLSISVVILIAITLSSILQFDSYLNSISVGFRMIISTVIASLVGAIIFPRKEIAKEEVNK